MFNPHNEECVICFSKSVVSKGTRGFWRDLDKLLIGIRLVRSTFSSDKIFLNLTIYFAAVDIALIIDIEFNWTFLVCENYISQDIPCLINLPSQLTAEL